MRPYAVYSILSPIFFLSLSATAQICVDTQNGTGTSDGTPARPYRSVQEAIDAAASGQSVLVAAGVYNGDLRVNGKTVQLMGGFAGGSAAAYGAGIPGDFETRNPAVYRAELNGTGTDSVVTLLDAGGSVVDGFRISGGGGSTETLPYASNGGGIFAVGGAPELRNNTIEMNDPNRPGDIESFGGGIYAQDADILIEDNDIRDNVAARGAGMALFGGEVVVRRNFVRFNIGQGDHGGGIYVAAPAAEISENRIYGNEIGRDLGYGWGAGILVFNPGNHAHLSGNIIYENFAAGLGAGVFVDEGATATLENELIYANLVNPGQASGGAVYVDGGEINGERVGSVVTIVNCTITGNVAEEFYVGGNALFVEGGSTATVLNSILWGNGHEALAGDTSTLTITYSDVEGGFPGQGNISGDPLFADDTSGDFHLRSTAGRWNPGTAGGAGGFVMDSVTSPCIDAGDPASNVENELAPNGSRVNMGAYGNTAEASLSPAGGEGEGEGEGENGCAVSKTSHTPARSHRSDVLLLGLAGALLVGMPRKKR